MRADFRRGISRLTGFAREQQTSAIGELLPFAVAAESSGKPPLDSVVEVAAKLTLHIFRHTDHSFRQLVLTPLVGTP